MRKLWLLAMVASVIAFTGVSRSEAGLWNAPESTSLGGCWKWHPSFGYFADVGNGWVYHGELGWMYCHGTSTANVWFWNGRWGWMWSNLNTTSPVYPCLWRARDGAWVWYQEGSVSPNWFYNLRSSRWQSSDQYSLDDFHGGWTVAMTINGSVASYTVNDLIAVCGFCGYGAPPSTLSGYNNDFSFTINESVAGFQINGTLVGNANVNAQGVVSSTGHYIGSMTGPGIPSGFQWDETVTFGGQFVTPTHFQGTIVASGTLTLPPNTIPFSLNITIDATCQ